MNAKDYVAGLFDLTGHVGIVTGASRGLGLGQAKVLTDAGATVYNFSRSPHTEEEKIEGKLIDVPCDVTDYAAFEAELKRIIEKEGRLDFLVNNDLTSASSKNTKAKELGRRNIRRRRLTRF